MLVLTRRPNEQIIIRDNIVVTVVEVRRGKVVRLGIEAPADVPIHRQEVHEALQREKKQKKADNAS